MQHTITSGTDVAVTDSSYVAEGTLDLTLGFTPQPGRPITVVRNTGPAFISGTFSGIPHGGTVPLVHNGVTYNYIANYFGENGRSLVLQWPLIRLSEWTSRQSMKEVDILGGLAGKTVIATAAGTDHSLALTSDGMVFAWGENGRGQLGKPGVTSSAVPVAVDTSGALAGKTVVAVSAGDGVSFVLTSDGGVYGWGFNNTGQLGIGTVENSALPVRVDTGGVAAGQAITSVDCGISHCVALTEEGKVLAWGNNYQGQLGHDSAVNHSTVPVQVSWGGALAGKTVVAVSAGSNHSVAATTDGLVYSWGGNEVGQLGNGNTLSSRAPLAVRTDVALRNKAVTAVVAGPWRTVALTSTGEVMAWGANGSRGSLGNNSNSNSSVPVNTVGSLVGKVVTAIASDDSCSLAVDSDGQAHAWGEDNESQPAVFVPTAMAGLGPAVGKSVVAVSAGGYRNLALTDAGPPVIRVSPLDQMANAGATARFTAVADHPFPVSVRWQESSSGVAGPFVDIPDNPSALASTFTLASLSPGQNGHAYRAVIGNISGVVTTAPAVLTLVGWNATLTPVTGVPFQADSVAVSGELSLQLAFPPKPGSDITVIRSNGPAPISGEFTNVVQGGVVPLVHNGTTYRFIANYRGGNGRSLVLQWPCTSVAGWGSGYGGLLGDAGTNDQPSPVRIATSGPLAGKTIFSISAGESHVLALTSEGKVFAWGKNRDGGLGNGSTIESLVPVEVSGTGGLAGKRVVAISAGAFHSLALTEEGQIFTWGRKWLGSGAYEIDAVPVPLSLGGILAGKTVVAVSAGTSHDLALTSEGEIYGWGQNDSGQLGDGATGPSSSTFRVDPVRVGRGEMGTKPVTAIAAGAAHSIALTLDGRAYTWGYSGDGALGNGSAGYDSRLLPAAVTSTGAISGKKLVSVAAVGSRCLTLSSDGLAFGWGNDESGQLGNGIATDRWSPVAVYADGALAGKSLTSLFAGASHTMALDSDGLAYAWGDNDSYNLGTGVGSGWNDSLVPVAVDSTGILSGRRVTSLSGNSDSSLAIFGEGAPEISRHPLDQLASSGSSVTFSSASVSPFETTVRWQMSEAGGPFVDIQGNPTALTGKLTLSAVTTGQNGNAYRAVFTNDAGHVLTDPATLAVPDWSAVFNSAADVPYRCETVKVSGSIPLELGFAPSPGTNLTVIENTGPSFILGAFGNLPQGGRITLHYNGVSYDFIVNYYGGNGRSLVLQWPWIKLAGWGANSAGQLANGSVTSTSIPVPALRLPLDKMMMSGTAGSSHNLVVTSDGKALSWGVNGSGQLGNGSNLGSTSAVEVDATGVLAGKTVVATSGGTYHSLALTSSGEVFSWGANSSGLLGNNGPSSGSSVPVAVDVSGVLAGKTLTAISAGNSHSLALDSEGRVYAWGDNSGGKLGAGGVLWSAGRVPLAVVDNGALLGKTVISVVAGGSHSVALSSDGKVFTWGSNIKGALGDDTIAESYVPVAVATHGMLAGKRVIAVAAGSSHTMALTSEGRVFTWGGNEHGQLGNGSMAASFVPVDISGQGALAGKTAIGIEAGNDHCMALTSEGKVVCWGYNQSGGLGDGTTVSSSVPLEVGGLLASRSAVAVLAGTSHSLAMYGVADGPSVTAAPLGRTVMQGTSPDSTTVSFTASASDVFPFSTRWQVSTAGASGPFSDIADNASASAGTLVIPAVTTAQDGWSYRAVFSNNGGTSVSAPALLRVKPVTGALTFTSAGDVALTESNAVLTGGVQINLGFSPLPGTELTVLRNTGTTFLSGEFSNLPEGSAIPLSYGGRTFEFIVNYHGGNGRSLVLQWGRTRLTSWGANLTGEPGSSLSVLRRVPALVDANGVTGGKTVVKVSAGAYHTLALTSAGRILTWGANGYGQLGNNSTAGSGVIQEVDFSGELSGKRVVSVAAGESHSLALTSDGRVYSWGSNAAGQLGNGVAGNSSIPVAVSTAGVLAGQSVVAIAAGANHNLALTSEGTIVAWGQNQFGQLGDQTVFSKWVPVEVHRDRALLGKAVVNVTAGATVSLALDSDGGVYAWGSNALLQLGQGYSSYSLASSPTPLRVGGSSGSINGKTVVSVAAGAYHCLALTSDGKLHTWGSGPDGQMGQGSSSGAYPVPLTMNGALSGKTVARMAAGLYHSLAITSDGQTVTWGKNDKGQLGDNTTSNRSLPVAVTTAAGLLGGNTTIAVVGGTNHTVALSGVGMAPVVTDDPDDQTIPAGGTVAFTSLAEGYPGSPTVRWQSSAGGPGGTFLNISTTATPSAATTTLQLTNVSAARNGYAYRAVFTNADAVVYSTPAVLTVIPPPQIAVPPAITVDATGKNGASVPFNVTATDSTDGTLMPTCNPPSGSVFPIGTTTVTCTVTNSLGSISNASFTVTVRRSYASFADLHQLAGSAPEMDPHHSGINNLLAYAFGIDPAAPDRRLLPTVSLVEGHLQISYTRWKDAADLQYIVEVSDDMETWNSGAGHTEQLPPTVLDATRETVVGRDLTPFSGSPSRFIRVRVVK